MSSNWIKLKTKLAASKPQENNSATGVDSHIRKLSKTSRKRTREISQVIESSKASADASDATSKPEEAGNIVLSSKYKHLRPRIVAMDCEMVGIGINGKHSALARCSIVDFYGNTVYDKFVRPPAMVTDFRTKWSGIRKSDLRIDHAVSLPVCQEEVANLLRGKILVGHALKNDLNALLLKHDKSSIRDTSSYRPYMRPHDKKAGKFKPRALKDLSRQHLKKVIQTGEHDSVRIGQLLMI
jgi:RNA exonuclease 4